MNRLEKDEGQGIRKSSNALKNAQNSPYLGSKSGLSIMEDSFTSFSGFKKPDGTLADNKNNPNINANDNSPMNNSRGILGKMALNQGKSDNLIDVSINVNMNKNEEGSNSNQNTNYNTNKSLNKSKDEYKNQNLDNSMNKKNMDDSTIEFLNSQRKINEEDVKNASFLILEEVTGEVLRNNKLKINAAGLTTGLRKAKDGVAFFGKVILFLKTF